MDDNINANKGYYASESLSAKSLNPRISYIRKFKYPPKLLVWLAISKKAFRNHSFVLGIFQLLAKFTEINA